MKVIIGFVVILLAASCAEDTPVTPTADVLQAQPECPDGDQTVQIIAPNFGIGFAFEIDVYEASRFDATASSEGIGSEVACSISGVLPWTEVTFSEASAACQAAGKRLCTSDEWSAACGSIGLEYKFPYGRSYDATACRTESVASSATGSLSTCMTAVNGIMDMSGNLREWLDASGLAGGAFADSEPGLTCTSLLQANDSRSPDPGDGFRCCRTLSDYN